MRIKHYPGAKVKPEIIKNNSSGTDPVMGKSDGLEVVTLSGEQGDSDKWRLGGCPRCHGDVFLDSEDGELLGHCLQCGYVGTRIITGMTDIE
jgi:hypothetical protein